MSAENRIPPAVWRALEMEWSIIPLRDDKRPAVKSWKEFQQRRASAEEIAAWTEQQPAAWGIITGALSGVVVLDFDGLEGAATMERLGVLAHVLTPSGGFHLYCKYPGWQVPTLNVKAAKRLHEAWPGMDIRGDGGYAGFSGTVKGHDGAPGMYKWIRPSDGPDDLPEPVRAWILNESKRSEPAPVPPPPPPPRPPAANGQARGVDPEWLITEALKRAPVDGRNHAGMWLALQLRDNGFSEADANSILQSYAGRVSSHNLQGQRDPYRSSEWRASVRQAYSRPARAPIERGHGRPTAPPPPELTSPAASPAAPPPDTPAEPRADAAATAPDAPAGAPPAQEPEPEQNHETPLARTEQGNAERLKRRHGRNIHFVPKWGKWIIWDGKRWRPDGDGEIYRRAVATVRAIYDEVKRTEDDNVRRALANHALKSESRGALSAMVDLARHLAGVSIQPEALDSQPWLLNCQNGTLEVSAQQAKLRPHRREDLITKIVPCPYLPDAQCPRWLEFMNLIQAGNAEKIAYLQRCVGYSLFGDVSERVLFVPWGSGRNGKSTFLETIALLAGDYGMKTPSETLMMKQQNAPTNDIARMQGARYVYASETKEAGHLDVAQVKNLTGEAVLTARFLYGEIFEFRRLFKLWLATNHKPIIRNAEDQAIWDRLKLIEFTTRIPEKPEVRKSTVEAWFRAELSGILAWAVEGCRAYLRDGLGEPTAVTEATASYRDDMDFIGQFLEECTETGDYFSASAGKLYHAFRAWSEQRGERHSINQTAFGLRMTARGFEKSHNRYGWWYSGIKILDSVTGCDGNSINFANKNSREGRLQKNQSQPVTPVTSIENKATCADEEEF